MILEFFLDHPQFGLELSVGLLALIYPLLEGLVGLVPVGDQEAAGGVEQVLDVTPDLA